MGSERVDLKVQLSYGTYGCSAPALAFWRDSLLRRLEIGDDVSADTGMIDRLTYGLDCEEETNDYVWVSCYRSCWFRLATSSSSKIGIRLGMSGWEQVGSGCTCSAKI